MYWVNFLHIYQPKNQLDDVLEAVVNQSYRPIFRGLRNISNIKCNLNISGALTELLATKGYPDVIEDIRQLAADGKLEFTSTAKYHTFLPFLPEEETLRQIQINDEANRKYFGEVYRPVCFFPPEMAYDPKIIPALKESGIKLIILDEISYNGRAEQVPYDRTFKIKDSDIAVVFRERRISNLIMGGVVRNAKSFGEALAGEESKNRYIATAMDGETFGHHRPGLEQFLFEIMRTSPLKQIFLSEVPELFPPNGEVEPVRATWAASEKDIHEGTVFYSWHDPKNPIHQLQKEFYDFVLDLLAGVKPTDKNYLLVREKADSALASDQFFWASAEPWWSVEMIEYGAWELLNAAKSIPKLTVKQKEKIQEFYHRILGAALEWQRTGHVRKLSREYRETVKIPFKERTLEAGKPEVYQVFLDIMTQEMERAAKAGEFEKAILWRDGIWKLETKNDIYDTIHVTDLLRKELPEGELEKLMDKYREKYKKIKSGQVEQRRIE